MQIEDYPDGYTEIQTGTDTDGELYALIDVDGHRVHVRCPGADVEGIVFLCHRTVQEVRKNLS